VRELKVDRAACPFIVTAVFRPIEQTQGFAGEPFFVCCRMMDVKKRSQQSVQVRFTACAFDM
jgi:hypothetical protein